MLLSTSNYTRLLLHESEHLDEMPNNSKGFWEQWAGPQRELLVRPYRADSPRVSVPSSPTLDLKRLWLLPQEPCVLPAHPSLPLASTHGSSPLWTKWSL